MISLLLLLVILKGYFMLNEQLNIKNIKAKSHQLAIFSDKLEVDPLCIQTLPPVNALEK